MREALEQRLPAVILLRGPASVGKWTLGEYLAQHHRVRPDDFRRLPRLTAEASRGLVDFARVAPMGRLKLVLARLDGASEQSLNALLKLLEEPPPTIVFILTTVRPTLDTISSRSSVYGMGLLEPAELCRILETQGMSAAAAARASELGRGQVAAALTAERQDASRAKVLSVLKAVKDKDRALLESAAVAWDDDCHALLNRWVIEAITGRWQAFTDAETYGLTADGKLPRRILLALGSNARPRFVIRSAFDNLVSRR